MFRNVVLCTCVYFETVFFLSFTFKFVKSSFLSFCDDSSSPRKRSSCVSVSDCCPTSWSFWRSESGLLVKHIWAKWFFLWHVVPNALHSLGLWWEPQRPHGFLLCFCYVGFGGCFLSGGFVFWSCFWPTLIAAASKAQLVRVSILVLLVSVARTVLIATSSVSSVLRSSRSLTLLLSIAHTILSLIRLSWRVPNSQVFTFMRRSVMKASIVWLFYMHEKKR